MVDFVLEDYNGAKLKPTLYVNMVRNVVSVSASVNKKIKFKLLFNSGESLFKKIKSEQKRKIN